MKTAIKTALLISSLAVTMSAANAAGLGSVSPNANAKATSNNGITTSSDVSNGATASAFGTTTSEAASINGATASSLGADNSEAATPNEHANEAATLGSDNGLGAEISAEAGNLVSATATDVTLIAPVASASANSVAASAAGNHGGAVSYVAQGYP